jgi:hypothetical protein
MIRRFVLAALVSLSFVFVNYAQATKDTAEIIFDETDHNYGALKYKGNGTYEFVFKNTGKAPLIIKHVQPTCGCTVPEWEKQPVMPKGKGKIVVKYDTERIGPFIKTLRVFSNARNSPTELTIRGEVKTGG